MANKEIFAGSAGQTMIKRLPLMSESDDIQKSFQASYVQNVLRKTSKIPVAAATTIVNRSRYEFLADSDCLYSGGS